MKLKYLVLAILALTLTAGCASWPGGVASSTAPLNGRDYVVLGHAVGQDSMPLLLSFIPLSGPTTVQEAIDDAVKRQGGDAMINVTVDGYWHTWILFALCTTRVEGDVIRFTK
jgi:hypothetical protein